MKKLEKSVPVIRFKGFSEAWEQRKLEDILDVRSGRDYKHLDSGDIPVYGTGGYMLSVGEALSYEEDAIGIGRKGTIDKPYILNAPFWTVDTLFYTVPKRDSDLNFIHSIFQKINWKSKDESTGVPSLSKTTINAVSVFTPSCSEQKEIGTFFNKLDDTIALHQRKLDTLKQMKKGLLQQMFPKSEEDVPKIRFADFDEEWYQRKLGEISDKVIEKNKESTYFETLTNSAEYGIISQREFFNKDISNEKNLNGYYIVRENDFVYNPRISNYAPVGPIKRNKLGRIGIVSPLYYVFRTFDTNQSFLEYYFDGTVWHNFMLLNGDSGARADRFAIKDSVLKEMPIPYSTLYEQEKISFFLDEITIIINLHQNKLKKLSSLKKAYLQNMFI
ncbi:restriction endonuclease subunit S [Listeria monocytogenes]|nr:restriction endonuclease subunit S [Listeria monocytogenes]ECZ8706027.1 restriction endonuclease subunit S [Listeria monocytogenes]EGO6318905.1 restriction endonuclease subunit S [Listeria monocytogenes]EHE1138035.1 restriction endonuclease subunit S [Listeria monocytogenes]EHO7441254.1 restriction endonuclease subunit S [Listeria monocytogenes]